jgi:hypothetical protein
MAMGSKFTFFFAASLAVWLALAYDKDTVLPVFKCARLLVKNTNKG